MRYRFLISWRWLGVTAVAAVLIATCVWLGLWQHDRYEHRAATNDRIAAASQDSAQPLESVMMVGEPPATDEVWSIVTVAGEYDPNGQILIRNRSVEGKTGYEVITPLIMDNGEAVLVDRGWVPASDQGAMALPEVPAPPTGVVSITGRVRASESVISDLNQVDGINQARTINTEQIAETVAYDLVGGYITDTEPGDGLVAIPVREERSWQNFAYAYQWWLFALMIPIGVVMLARREAKVEDQGSAPRVDTADETADEPVAAQG